MKRMILPMFAACTLLVVLAACSDSTNPPAAPPAVTGVLTDANGDPVVDAAIVLDLDMVDQTTAFADKPSTAIVFQLSEPSPFELRITDACDDEVFYTFASADTMPAGTYSFNWTGADLEGLRVPEGVYHFHFVQPEHEPQVGVMMLAFNLGSETGIFATETCASVRQNWRVAAWTDDQGRFTITRDCWDFGRSTDRVDETGTVTGTVTVASRVRVWAYPADRTYGSHSAWVDFDATTGATVPFIVPARQTAAP